MTDVLAPPPPQNVNEQIWSGTQSSEATGLTVTDYARKIHWWVRLFGVVWLVSVALAVVLGGIAGVVLSSAADDAGSTFSPRSSISTSGSYSDFSSRRECMLASWTTASGCNLYFPTD
jgi:hypothetical protein